MKNLNLIPLLFLAVIFMDSCKKEFPVEKKETGENTVSNPYDTIQRPNTNPEFLITDSSSFLGLHQYIFSPKCAQPACHDGAFEPDFRTVQSAYSTLVYKSVVKTSPGFKYRIQPFDIAKSWLHERITTNDPVLGRMPLYSQPLSAVEIGRINSWIMKGAPDVLENPAYPPNGIPQFFGIVAYLPDSGNIRVDTRRGANPAMPFRVFKGSDVDVWFGLYDDSTLAPFFTYNKIRVGKNPVNVGNAPEQNLIIESTPKMAPAFGGQILPYYFHYVVNTSQFNKGDIVYMRIYVKDAHQTSPTEIPNSSSQFFLMSYFSMEIL